MLWLRLLSRDNPPKAKLLVKETRVGFSMNDFLTLETPGWNPSRPLGIDILGSFNGGELFGSGLTHGRIYRGNARDSAGSSAALDLSHWRSGYAQFSRLGHKPADQ